MKRIVCIGLLLGGFAAMAQKKTVAKSGEMSPKVVPLKPEAWKFADGAVVFDDSAGVSRMKIVDGRWFVQLKDMDFGDGTIEFDDIPTDDVFSIFYFRLQDSLENETFYFRTTWAHDHPYVMEAVQYTPIVKGVMYWDALPHYQTFSDFSTNKPNHVKIILSGKQMRVWVNHLGERPTLAVPYLEGNTTHGTFAFQGKHIISNLVVKPGQVEGLSPEPDLDPTDFDSRYLRHWQMTEPDTAGENKMLAGRLGIRGIPGEHAVWRPIDAERRGFVNLSRIFGGTSSMAVSRMMFLKTTLHAKEAKTVQLRLGFLDDISMFVNGRLIYADKNIFGFPAVKVPNGRLSIENSTVSVPLKAGDNELMVGIRGNFYSWGLVARLDDLEGLVIER
ncbi:hypothetical protein [Puia sp.]|uniref:hypothetical protein n=1 Tax=Puia sp. TaxID=2045100 RepID=UPI002F3EA04B